MTKILGIVSASYSGTTTLTMQLGALPGWFAAGETHWLRASPLDRFFCPECKGMCNYWTSELRQHLQETNRWWDTMRSGLANYDWLVASDKIPKFYEENPGVDHYVLQWKDPRGWFHSARRHDGIALSQAIVSWSNLYERAFRLIEADTPVTVVDWDKFSQEPLAGLNNILSDLGARPITSLPERAPSHMIGGNAEARGSQRSDEHKKTFGDTIRPDTRWQTGNSQEENDAIIGSERVQAVLARFSQLSKKRLTHSESEGRART